MWPHLQLVSLGQKLLHMVVKNFCFTFQSANGQQKKNSVLYSSEIMVPRLSLLLQAVEFRSAGIM